MIVRLLVALLLLTGSAEATTRFATNNGQTSGTCLSAGTACRLDYVLGLTSAGDTISLASGTYQGANNMLNLVSFAPSTSGTSGNVITVSAATDGGVFIDGQFTRPAVKTSNHSYWTFTGFDVGNGYNGDANNSLIEISGGTGLTFQRICAANLGNGGVATLVGENVHTWSISGVQSGLFEDLCGFGIGGRNVFITDYNGGHNNTFRRIWARHDGYKGNNLDAGRRTCQANTAQLGYHDNEPYNSKYENWIVVFGYDQITAGDPCYSTTSPTSSSVEPVLFFGGMGQSVKGMVGYTTSPISFPMTWPGLAMYSGGDNCSIDVSKTFTDIFIDTRSHKTAPFYLDLSCLTGSRVTALKTTSSDSDTWNQIGTGNTSFFTGFTNTNECTTTSACPNFYTGDTPGTGSRACFRYVDGTLTSTPLWPWPMDDRIKAARSRAGMTALAGTAGAGYAAATVTSEIVNRYGSIPTACLTSSSFTPSFPVASDFPSVSVRDDFNRANSGTLGGGWTSLLADVFSIASNAAAAPSTGIVFGRSIYSDTKVQTSHEVYGTWTTVQTAFTTALSFAGTDLTENNQYRFIINPTGSTTTVSITRVDGVGSSTTILSPVDLGIAIVNGNSFGVRVSGTTISAYWKWTDGIWYRVGQFTDSNLSSLPSTGVYVGIAGGSPAVIDNFGAGPFVDQPAQDPPTPPASVGVGRFGTTFPGVR